MRQFETQPAYKVGGAQEPNKTNTTRQCDGMHILPGKPKRVRKLARAWAWNLSPSCAILEPEPIGHVGLTLCPNRARWSQIEASDAHGGPGHIQHGTTWG